MIWWKELKGKVRLREPLRRHTTLKIGGPVKFFIQPKDTDDLKLLLNLLKRHKIHFLIIGGGSNILSSDKGLDACVIQLNAPFFKRISLENGYLKAGAGAGLNRVILKALSEGLSGAEFLAGIPGTVGGALVMNAGIPGSSIGDLVKDVTVMGRQGNIKTLKRRDIKFSYRHSSLSDYIILSAHLKLNSKDKKEIRRNIKGYLNYRGIRQDLSRPSAGCIFRNPRGLSVGRLIDLCGLKGKRMGNAFISLRHANFILNKGKAKAKDVLGLMDLIKKKVKNKFNLKLEPEIKIWQ